MTPRERAEEVVRLTLGSGGDEQLEGLQHFRKSTADLIERALLDTIEETKEKVKAVLMEHRLHDLNATHIPELCPYCQAWAEIRKMGEK